MPRSGNSFDDRPLAPQFRNRNGMHCPCMWRSGFDAILTDCRLFGSMHLTIGEQPLRLRPLPPSSPMRPGSRRRPASRHFPRCGRSRALSSSAAEVKPHLPNLDSAIAAESRRLRFASFWIYVASTRMEASIGGIFMLDKESRACRDRIMRCFKRDRQYDRLITRRLGLLKSPRVPHRSRHHRRPGSILVARPQSCGAMAAGRAAENTSSLCLVVRKRRSRASPSAQLHSGETGSAVLRRRTPGGGGIRAHVAGNLFISRHRLARNCCVWRDSDNHFVDESRML